MEAENLLPFLVVSERKGGGGVPLGGEGMKEQVKHVNPVKYVSPVGGLKPPTATNLLPPISSTALFNWVNET